MTEQPKGFDDLGLCSALTRAVAEAGYRAPTRIQTLAIPPALRGDDVVGCAQTGTGKTAAFVLPLLQRLDATAGDEPTLRALVLTPTRELAAQIAEATATYGKHLDLWHTVIFGGVKDRPQIAELRRGVDLLVATPGRLLDLMGRGVVDLGSVEAFVLDEADRMLDMGFLPDVKRVVRSLPQPRQTLFFSATMPPEIRELADRMLRPQPGRPDPVTVNAAPVATPAERIAQNLYFVDKRNKRKLLLELLDGRPDIERALVFSRTKHGANRIAKVLDHAGIRSAAIHGNKSQNARTRALEGFREGTIPVLVATDIAARGIDVEGVTHVINFDLPNVPETYVHRIGRTARAGASGVAMSFCDDDERAYLRDIERLMGRHLDRVATHGFVASDPPPPMTDLEGRHSSRGQGSRGQGSRGQGSRGQGSRGRGGASAPSGRGRAPGARRRGPRKGRPRLR
ncbi:MAG: DEAD/DEAH box helicase [Myxococcota bacterium]